MGSLTVEGYHTIPFLQNRTAPPSGGHKHDRKARPRRGGTGENSKQDRDDATTDTVVTTKNDIHSPPQQLHFDRLVTSIVSSSEGSRSSPSRARYTRRTLAPSTPRPYWNMHRIRTSLALSPTSTQTSLRSLASAPAAEERAAAMV